MSRWQTYVKVFLLYIYTSQREGKKRKILSCLYFELVIFAKGNIRRYCPKGIEASAPFSNFESFNFV